MDYIILVSLSIIVVFYVCIDLVFRKQISYLSDQLSWKKKDKRYLLLGLFFTINKFIKNSSKLISVDAQKSIRYFFPIKYYKFYESIFICKKISISFFILAGSLFLASLNNMPILGLIGLVFSIIMFYLLDISISNKFKKVKNNIQLDLPKLLTKLSLLIDSGINYRNSIEMILDNSEGKLYEELNIIKALIDNGLEEKKAYTNLSRISEDMLVKKFISLILQNIYKGDEKFSSNLKVLKEESFRQKRNFIIDQTQKAGQKLLLPNLIIFMGIMVMVMVPILLNAF